MNLVLLAEFGDYVHGNDEPGSADSRKERDNPTSGANLEKALAIKRGKAVHGEFAGPIIFRAEHAGKNPDGFSSIRNVVGATMASHQPKKNWDSQQHLPPASDGTRGLLGASDLARRWGTTCGCRRTRSERGAMIAGIATICNKLAKAAACSAGSSRPPRGLPN